METSFRSFLPYWSKVRSRTTRVVACIPGQHLEWTYRDGKFTLGDIVRHLGAAERYLWAETVCGRPSSYPGHGPNLADGCEAVMAFFDRMHEETVELLGSLPDERLEEKCETPDGARLRVWKWLRAMVEHEVHHRGQIYTYLGMLDVETPPLYGLTSEEVRSRSVPRGL